MVLLVLIKANSLSLPSRGFVKAAAMYIQISLTNPIKEDHLRLICGSGLQVCLNLIDNGFIATLRDKNPISNALNDRISLMIAILSLIYNNSLYFCLVNYQF